MSTDDALNEFRRAEELASIQSQLTILQAMFNLSEALRLRLQAENDALKGKVLAGARCYGHRAGNA